MQRLLSACVCDHFVSEMDALVQFFCKRLWLCLDALGAVGQDELRCVVDKYCFCA
jgi:hypothetical protein